MTREKFTEILKEYGYSEYWINRLWETSPIPAELIREQTLRNTAIIMILQLPLFKDNRES